MLENVMISVSEVDPVVAGVVCGVVMACGMCYTFKSKIKSCFVKKEEKKPKKDKNPKKDDKKEY